MLSKVDRPGVGGTCSSHLAAAALLLGTLSKTLGALLQSSTAPLVDVDIGTSALLRVGLLSKVNCSDSRFETSALQVTVALLAFGRDSNTKSSSQFDRGLADAWVTSALLAAGLLSKVHTVSCAGNDVAQLTLVVLALGHDSNTDGWSGSSSSLLQFETSALLAEGLLSKVPAQTGTVAEEEVTSAELAVGCDSNTDGSSTAQSLEEEYTDVSALLARG